MEIYQLAMDMVRLDRWADDAMARHRLDRVNELLDMRDHVRDHRSELMRHLWARYGVRRAAWQ